MIKKKINMSDEFRSKIDWSCKFNNRHYQIIEGYIKIMEHTNLSYVEPHKIIIKGITFLAFNYSNEIKLSELEVYLKGV